MQYVFTTSLYSLQHNEGATDARASASFQPLYKVTAAKHPVLDWQNTAGLDQWSQCVGLL